MSLYLSRVKRVISNFASSGIDALFITNPVNIFYLTGFKGHSLVERESVLLVTRKGATLYLPKLYEEAFKKLKISGIASKIIEERHYLFSLVCNDFGLAAKVGVEADNIRLNEFDELVKNSKAKFVRVSGLVEKVRLIKDELEIKSIKKAVEITDKGFQKIKKEIKIGMTEKEVAKRLEEIFEELGADGAAFDSIVASGSGSSLPHYVPTDNKIKKGILLIDAGARYKGYNGDLTRTFYIGKPDKNFIDRYNLVLNAQKLALENTKEGITEEDLWKVSVDALGDQSKFFIHGLGHGIGIDVHEDPYLRKDKKGKLAKGMLVTVEPGLYYAGWGGIRIEDYVYVDKKGCKILSTSPKDIKDMII